MIKTPFLAVDGIVEIYSDDSSFRGIVLIDRLNKPTGLAIPGGFVDIGETVETVSSAELNSAVFRKFFYV